MFFKIQNLILIIFILIPNACFSEIIKNNTQKTNYISFNKVLPLAIKNNKKVLISINNSKASFYNYKASKSSFYPKLDITANVAEQDNSNPNSANESFSPREYNFKITQPLWDFEENWTKVEIASLRSKLSKINIAETKTKIILKATRDYSNFRKAKSRYLLSLEFEKKLKKQTGFQDYRIKQGAAISTDLLQAKNALANAITSRVIAYGNFQRSKINFFSTFNFLPDIKIKILPVNVPLKLIPKNMEQYIKNVLKNGYKIQKARINKQISDLTKSNAFAANFLPKFTLTGEVNHKDNYSGTPGYLTENIVKVEMKWPIELFGTQIDKYNSSNLVSDNANTQYRETVKEIKEVAQSTWISFQNEKTNLEFINNQVNISKQFLKMANLEFKKGRGSMNLVVSAQNAFFNSQTSLKEAVAKFALTSYSLLSSSGKLSIKNLNLLEKRKKKKL